MENEIGKIKKSKF